MSTTPEPESDGGIHEIPRESLPARVPSSGGYQVMSMSQLLERPTQPWLIKRVVRQGDLVVIYGDPSVGKTFIALDMVLRFVTGLDWWGRGTAKGSVLYCAGEGVGGLRQRVSAWGIEHKVELRDLQFSVLPQAINLLDETQFAKLMETLDAMPSKPVAIVIDTLARYMAGGDENSAQDMGLLIDRCAQIQAKTGAAIFLVHHKNKNATAERGSSALRGAVDVMIEVRRNGHSIEVEGSKAKDTTQLPKFWLTTKSIYVGEDPDGEIETSLVLELGTEPVAAVECIAPGAPQRDPTKTELVGTKIRSVLAQDFKGGPANGGDLFTAAGCERSTYYAALKAEVAARRIESVGDGRRKSYCLSPAAPEFARLSLSSKTPSNSDLNSGHVAPTRAGESEFELSAPPKGAATNSDSTAATETGSEVSSELEDPSEGESGNA